MKQKRSDIPAVTHIDYSARVQTLNKKTNPFIYSVLSEYKKITNCSVLINTSFNVRGEPIILNEIDAFNCFMNTDMDYVVIGSRLFCKSEQNKELYKSIEKGMMKNVLD